MEMESRGEGERKEIETLANGKTAHHGSSSSTGQAKVDTADSVDTPKRANGNVTSHTLQNGIHPHPLRGSGSTSKAYVDPFVGQSTRDYTDDMLPANWNETDLSLDVTDLDALSDMDDAFDSDVFPRKDLSEKHVKTRRRRRHSLRMPNSPRHRASSLSSGLLSQARSILRSSFPGSVPETEDHLPLSSDPTSTFDDRGMTVAEDEAASGSGSYPPASDSSRVESTLKRWEREEMERRAAARKARNRRRPIRIEYQDRIQTNVPASSQERWTQRAHWWRDLLCACCDRGEDDPHLDPELQYGERSESDDWNATVETVPPSRHGKMRSRPDDPPDSVVGHPRPASASASNGTEDAAQSLARARSKLKSVNLTPRNGPVEDTSPTSSPGLFRSRVPGQTAKTNPFE